MKNKKIIVICGPTASGKTKLAVKVAKALKTEVISADSMLVYKGFNVGTAKPNTREMDGVRHHMIDVVDGNADFSVANYREQALPIVENLLAAGKTPIICGGTGFYINSLLFPMSYGNACGDQAIREKYAKICEVQGKEHLFSLLEAADPLTAAKLHPNDVRRVIRALEIYETNGKAKSAYVDDARPIYEYAAFAYDYDRDELYSRIDTRVEEMFANGLIDEVSALLASGIRRDAQAMQGIGYKEVLKYIDGAETVTETIRQIKINSRHYAKRQLTFFKKFTELEMLSPSADVKEVLEIYDR